MKKTVFITVLMLMMFSSVMAWAATYYVDKNSLGGPCSDSNPGTYAEPWCTIAFGISNLVPGDILYIRDGVYSEVVAITKSGDEQNQIVVAGYPNEKPVIDGEYTRPNKGSCTVSGDCPDGYSCDENYHVCGNGLCDPVSGNCFIYDGLVKITGEFVTLENLEIEHSFGHGIQVDPSSGNCIIRDCWVHDNRASGISIYRAKPHHLIENCKVYNNCNFAPYSRSAGELNWPGGLAWRATEDVTVSHCEVYNNWGEGIIMMWAENAKILNNEVYDNFAAEIYGDAASDVLVAGNLVYNTGDEIYFRDSSPCRGIWFDDEPAACNDATTRTNNIKIINNLLSCNGINIVVAGGCESGYVINSLIANNTSVNPSSQTLSIVSHNEAVQQSMVINNIFYQSGGVTLNLENTNTIKFSNNVWSLEPTFPSNVIHPAISGDLKLLVVSDPKLNNLNGIINTQPGEKIESNWFKILPSSPAINAAVKTNDVVYDYFGIQRDNCPDVGAIEHTGY